MNQKLVVLAIGLLVSALLAWAPPASAQKKVLSPTIAVVDMQAVMSKSEAAKSIGVQVAKLRTSFQQSFQSKKDELQKLNDDIQRQRAILSADALQQRQREFQQKYADAQKDFQARGKKIEGAVDKAAQQVDNAAQQVIDQIAKESGITLVLNRAAVIHVESSTDITPEVIKRLNAKLSSVTVNVPK